jgi:Flp pilus assembly protein TadG
MKHATSRKRSWGGQALVEFALVLPLLFLLILNVVNFGVMLYSWVTVANSARTGVQYLVMGGSYAHGGRQAGLATVVSRVYDDLASLSNSGTKTTVAACLNNGGVFTCYTCTQSTSCASGTSGTTPNDPENAVGSPATFRVASLDVTYQYTPFISGWNFPSLGIYLTTPPTSIHRQSVMRAF